MQIDINQHQRIYEIRLWRGEQRAVTLNLAAVLGERTITAADWRHDGNSVALSDPQTTDTTASATLTAECIGETLLEARCTLSDGEIIDVMLHCDVSGDRGLQ